MAVLGVYKTGAQAGEKHKFPVDRNCSRLLLKRFSPLSLMGGLASGAPERVVANIRTHNNDVEEVFRLEPLLSHIVAYSAAINNTPVYELGLLDGGGSAAAIGIDLAGADVLTSKYLSYLFLDLTKKGDAGIALGVNITADDDFGVLVSNMLADTTYVLESVEEPLTGTNILSYTSINMIAGQKSRLINVDALEALVLPATTAIHTIKVQYAVGKPVEYTVEQLKITNAQAFEDEVYQLNYASAGVLDKPNTISPLTSELLVLMLHNVVSIELVTDGTQLEFTQVVNRQRGTSNQFN
jgi:hypothetical protein